MLSSIITPDNNSISYSYNNLKQLAGVLNYDGEYITYTYDLMGNISTISKDEETMATYTYNDKNLLSSVTYPGQGSTTYGYDWIMRLDSLTNTLADGTAINSYEYDYDRAGNQSKKTETVGTETKVTNYTYDGLNRLSSYTAPDGTVTTYTFDARNNITRESIAHSAESTFDYSYYGDDYAITIENITSHTKDYTYNSANQLITETESLVGESWYTDGTFNGTNTYSYDSNGNIDTKIASGDYDSSIEYDYSFDAFNRLKTINESRIYYYEDVLDEYEYTYTYNGNNELVNFTNEWNGELSVTKNYYWDRGYIVNEDFASSWKNTITNYYLGVDGVFAQDNGTNTDYLLKNAHGDTVKLLRNGSLYDSAEYDPYGNYTDWNSYSSYGYANYYYDSYSGFYYLRNRFYDPSIGRFISEDPIQDGINWYAYCNNDPINRIDPEGTASFREKWDALWKVGPFDATSINKIGNETLIEAQNYASKKGLVSCTDNIADAYRHFSWNYKAVKQGISVEDVMQATTNHEVLTQEYMGKDSNGTKYYKVALSSLMDLMNNQIGRYQATLPANKNKDSLKVFESLASIGGVVTSLEQVKQVWGIKDDWLYPATEGVRGEVSVLIKHGLEENALNIIAVNKDEIEFK